MSILNTFRRKTELKEEIESHFKMAIADRVARGESPAEAHRAAMREFGNVPLIADVTRERWGFLRLERLTQDLRFALRQLRRSPGFALTAIFVLALGIAACVAIFAFVDAALIKPLPYQAPKNLVMLFESIPLGPRFHLSYPDYIDWKRENKVFTSLNVFAPFGFMMKTPDGLRQTDGARVSAGFFRTLGVEPVLGRNFYDGEDRPETPRTTLLTYAAWQKRYGGNPKILGQSVILDGDPYIIIGVLPRDFSFAPAEPADFWAIMKPNTCRGCHGLFGVARLRDGVTFAAAFADITTIAKNLEKQYPDSNRDQAAFMLPLTQVIVGDIQPILLVALCGAGLLMLIAAVNVSSLLLVRAESRRRETSIRGALGASRSRLVAQFVTEGLLLAAIGCSLGVVLAQQGMHILTLLIPKDMRASLPFLVGLGLNGRVVAFAFALAVLASLLFAFIPLSRFRSIEIRDGLLDGGRASASTTWRKFGSNLVVIELTTAMVLLAGAGLLAKGLYRLLHTDIGIVPDHIAMVHVQAPNEKYGNHDQQLNLVQEILRHVSALPGVKSAAVTTKLPIEDADWTTSFVYVGRPNDAKSREVAFRSVTADYMATLQTRLLNGRYFRNDEDASRPFVVIINRALATKYFPGEDPVGKQIAFDVNDKHPMSIVGVIDDIQEGQLDAAPRGAMYVPFYQHTDNGFVVLARTAQDESSLIPSLLSAIRSVDSSMALYEPMTMNQKIHDAPETYLHRSSAWLVGGFATIALFLGVVGLYGIVSYSVGQRAREIGVRMALGAQKSTIYRLILSESARLIFIGIAIGLVASITAASFMRKLLFGVQAWDATTLIGVGVLLAAASLLASFLPARRAASMNPTDALRSE